MQFSFGFRLEDIFRQLGYRFVRAFQEVAVDVGRGARPRMSRAACNRHQR